MDVVVVGSCNIDTFMYLEGTLPRPGETVPGARVETDFGGKGANQAVMASRLRVRTGLVAKLGSFILGHDYLVQLTTEGIETTHVTRTGIETMTGSAYITVDKFGQNTIVTLAGANALLSVADIEEAKMMLTSTKTVVFQLETPLTTSLHAMRMIHREYGTIRPLVILNPAPCEDVLSAELTSLVDVIVANELETESITGVHINDDEYTNTEVINRAVNALLSCAQSAAVITLGSRGCALAYKDQSSQVSNVVVRLLPVNAAASVVDTVGAGDAFVGSLAAFLARGVHVEDACALANKVASLTVAVSGAQTSYPTLDTIQDEDIMAALSAPDCADRPAQFTRRN